MHVGRELFGGGIKAFGSRTHSDIMSTVVCMISVLYVLLGVLERILKVLISVGHEYRPGNVTVVVCR